MESRIRWARLILRLGLAAVFVYAGLDSLLEPNVWVGYLPTLLVQLVPAMLFLKVFAVYELALTAWLLWGRYMRYAAVLAALTLSGILVANLGALAITFRDMAIVAAAVALAVLA